MFSFFKRKPNPAPEAGNALQLRLQLHTEGDDGLSDTDCVATLAASYEIEESGDDREICDYRSLRVLKIQPSVGQYTSSALMASISFRRAEFGNRVALGNMFAAGGGDPTEVHMTPPKARHLLSQGPADRPELQWKGGKASASCASSRQSTPS